MLGGLLDHEYDAVKFVDEYVNQGTSPQWFINTHHYYAVPELWETML